jgi:hypothetical protein
MKPPRRIHPKPLRIRPTVRQPPGHLFEIRPPPASQKTRYATHDAGTL